MKPESVIANGAKCVFCDGKIIRAKYGTKLLGEWKSTHNKNN